VFVATAAAAETAAAVTAVVALAESTTAAAFDGRGLEDDVRWCTCWLSRRLTATRDILALGAVGREVDDLDVELLSELAHVRAAQVVASE
jgi:hypothetical protein